MLNRCLNSALTPSDWSSWNWKAFCMLPELKGNDHPSYNCVISRGELPVKYAGAIIPHKLWELLTIL